VHTTQIAVHDNGMLKDVWALAVDVHREAGSGALLVAGVQGSTEDAVREAELAADLGYHLALVRPEQGLSEDELVERTRAIGEVLPTVGFYLQPAVGGRILSADYWARIASLPTLAGIKIAGFDPYRTLDVFHGVCRSGRAEDVALYTGNDNSILTDLSLTHRVVVDGTTYDLAFVGGLLGQWSVWTRRAVQLRELAVRGRHGDDAALREALSHASALTDANAAIFDVEGAFHGSIAGINEVLRRHGLLRGAWCLDPDEVVSDRQRAQLDRIWDAYPDLRDDDFIAANLDDWLR
jgi:dihydrodipicolinate synthase/N-acetylneuraminate lyase